MLPCRHHLGSTSASADCERVGRPWVVRGAEDALSALRQPTPLHAPRHLQRYLAYTTNQS
jgi:hypothetical protein